MTWWYSPVMRWSDIKVETNNTRKHQNRSDDSQKSLHGSSWKPFGASWEAFDTLGTPGTELSGGSNGCTPIFTSIWQKKIWQMGLIFGVDPGLPFGLYFFPLTSEQLSIIYIRCQEHISEQFLFLLLFCFCWHWWSEGPICGTFLQESKSWSKLSPYHRFEGTSKTEIDQGFQKNWSHPRQSIL